MTHTLRIAALGLVACALGRTAWAQGGSAASVAEHKAVAPDDIKWGDAPPILQKGAKLAVLFGDPSKEGLFIVRLKVPANYKIMPHTHPTAENVTIISGAFAIGMGDKLDPKAKVMPAGSFFSMPAGMHHFAFSTKETVVEVTAMGPFVVNYLNPDDDPSKAAPAAPAAKN